MVATSNGDGRIPGTGRFGPGNKYGGGNSHARAVARNCRRLQRAITPTAARQVVAVLLRIVRDPLSKPADRIAAGREVLDRYAGKARQPIDAEMSMDLSAEVRGPDLRNATDAELEQLHAIAERMKARERGELSL